MTPPRSDDPTDDELRRLVRRGRRDLASVDVDDLLTAWDRVQASLWGADDPPSAPSTSASTPVPAAPAATSAGDTSDEGGPRVTGTTERAVTSTTEGSTSTGTAPASGWGRAVPLAAAAMVALVVGAAGGVLAARSIETQPVPATLATARLEPVGGGTTPGVDAAVRGAADGPRTVEVDLTGLSADDGFLELWLLDPTTGAMTSLGPSRPDATYVIPDGTDVASLPVLDVSLEPHDGDPTHSGDSLLRGEVRWTG